MKQTVWRISVTPSPYFYKRWKSGVVKEDERKNQPDRKKGGHRHKKRAPSRGIFTGINKSVLEETSAEETMLSRKQRTAWMCGDPSLPRHNVRANQRAERHHVTADSALPALPDIRKEFAKKWQRECR